MSKDFLGVPALQEVDLALRAGEVHALLGENGAGKSTLIKACAGIHQPSSGHLEIDGVETVLRSPVESQAAGISVIAQELELVPSMTVAENMFLGHEPRRRGGLLDWGHMRRRGGELLDELGVQVDLAAPVETLSIADQQLVEIAKALTVDFRILIMDEPTAALNASDVARLFDVIRRLRDRGVAMLYVSHRLHEVTGIADRVSVLRDGSYVGGGPITEFSESALAELIVGREVQPVRVEHRPGTAAAPAALQLRGLSVAGVFEDIDLTVASGEVVGVAGLVGSGRSELLHAIVGAYPSMDGTIEVGGKPARIASPRHAMERGVVFLSEDRKAEGILPDLTVRENLMLARRRGLLSLVRARDEQAAYERMRERLNIRAASPDLPITSLSGGNQQKVLVGRALATGCRIIVLSEPTRGVDIGARAEIHQIVRDLAADGFAVLVSSADVPELVSVSDRCLVLSSGRTVAMLVREEIEESTIVRRTLVGHQEMSK